MSETITPAAPATVPIGSRVVLVVSDGPFPSPPEAYLAVPDIVGQSQGSALTKLQDAGFGARVVNDYSPKVSRGHVMGQLPSGGAHAASGSEVALLISSGAPPATSSPIRLPDVVGKPEEDAVAAISKAGLNPQVSRQFSATVPAGIVMDQLPSRASLATSVSDRRKWYIIMGIGAALVAVALIAAWLFGPGAKVTVPDVVGQSEAEATNELEDAGLKVVVTIASDAGDAEPGTVISQDPPAGDKVDSGDTETIEVAPEAAELVRVPNVRGLPQAEAVESLEALGLKTNTVTRQVDSEQPGTVVAQDPTQGVQVEVGTTVKLTIATASAPGPVELPDVGGLTGTDAKSTLEGLGLEVLVVENADTQVAEQVVIDQLPAAGQEVEPGATVAIVVSTGAPSDAATIAVPDVVGEELPDAQEELAKAGLKSQPLAVEGNAENANDVLDQTPAGGSDVAPGSTVVLLYAR